MQSNPMLTVLKILAFAVLAFLVGMTSWQRANLEDKVTSLDGSVATLARQVESLSRDLKAGAFASSPGGTSPGGRGSSGWTAPDGKALDAALDPSKPVGTPGRYADFVSPDPDPEYPPESATWDKGVLGRWFGPEPKGFNFVTENDAGVSDYIELYVGESPARTQWRNPSKYKPAACWRVEVSPDYKEYTLFFRKDAVWHPPVVDFRKYAHLDGTHQVTAQDYKFTLDTILNPQTDCAPTRGYYTDVESVELIDDYTAVVRWKKTLFHSISFTLTVTLMPEFLYAFGEDGKRFPEATIGQSFNDHWYNRVGFCGCGPYRFVSYERGQRILLTRFEDWFGTHDGIRYPIRDQRLLIYPDPVTNLLKIRAGEVEVGRLTSPQWKEVILDNVDPTSPFKNGEIQHWIGKSANYLYFGWKNTHPLFTDARVRKALALACNRAQICRDIFLDKYRPMSSPIYPESSQADPDLQPLPFDLKAAATLLDEAGWKMNSATGLREKEVKGQRKAFDFNLLWPGPAPDFEAALNQYKNDLLSIGIRMDPQSMEWAAYQKRLKDREFEACSLLWATSGWEHDFDQIWHSRGIQDPGSSNHIEFSNKDVDELSDRLREEMDEKKRAEMVRRIGRILYDEQPYCFFGWRNEFGVNRSYVKNVTEHESRTRPFQRVFPMWVER